MTITAKPVAGQPVAGQPITGRGVGLSPIGGEGEVTVLKFVNQSICNPTDILLYTVVVDNRSGDVANNITITDDIDSPFATLVNGSATVDHPNGTITNDTGTVQVDISSLPDTEAATITYQVTANLAGNILNTAEYTIDGSPSESSNQIGVQCSPPPVFTVDKSANPAVYINPGFTISYSVSIENTGGLALNCVYTDPLKPLLASYPAGSVSTTKGIIQSGQGTNDTEVVVSIGQMANGEIVTITYQITIKDPYPNPLPDTYNNQGVLHGDNFPDAVSQTVVINVEDFPEFPVLKVVDSTAKLEGDRVIYDVTGTVAVSEIINAFGTDSLDPNLTLDPTQTTTTHGTFVEGDQPGDTKIQIDLGTLPVSTAVAIHYEAVIADPYVGFINNQINFTADNQPGGADSNVVVVDVAARVPSMAAVKSVDDVTALPGQTLTYTVDITNSGNRDADAPFFVDGISDPGLTLVPGSVTAPGGTIINDTTDVRVDYTSIAQAGGTEQITYQCVVEDPFPGGLPGQATNQGSLSGANFTTINSNAVLVNVAAVPIPAFSIILSMNPTSLNVGDTTDVTITIENTGLANATNFILSNPYTAILDNPTAINSTHGTPTDTGSAIQLLLASFLIGQTTTVTYTIEGIAEGSPTMQAFVDCDEIPTVGSNIVSFSVSYVYSSTRVLSSDSVGDENPGNDILYTVVITNTGTGPLDSSVYEDEIGDVDLDLVPGSATTDVGSITQDDTRIEINLGTLASLAVANITYSCTINAGMPSGTVSAQGRLTTNQLGIEFTNQVDTNVVGFTYTATVVKSSNVVGDANPGDTVTYTVDLTKTGTGDIDAVVLEDEISDADLTLVNGSATTDQGSITQDDTRVEVNVGILGSTPVQITYQALINAGMTVPGVVSNQATLTSTQIASQNSNQVDVNVVAAPVGDDWTDITSGYPNADIESDVLALGQKSALAPIDWEQRDAASVAWHVDDGTPARSGNNVFTVFNDTSAVRIDNLTLDAFQTLRVTVHSRSTPLAESTIALRMRLISGGTSITKIMHGTSSPGRANYGLHVAYYCFDYAISNASVTLAFNISGRSSPWLLDDLIVEKSVGWHPHALNPFNSSNNPLSQGYSIGGEMGLYGSDGAYDGGYNVGETVAEIYNPISFDSSSINQPVVANQAMVQTDGSIRFDGISDNYIGSPITAVNGPFTFIMRFKLNQTKTTTVVRLGVSGSTRPDLAVFTTDDTLKHRDSLNGNVVVANSFLTNYVGVDITLIWHCDLANSYVEIVGGPTYPFTLTNVVSANLPYLSPSNTCDMDFWGCVCFPGNDPTEIANSVAYLAKAGTFT